MKTLPSYTMWNNASIGKDMIDLVRRRTEFIYSVILHSPRTPLQNLFMSAYLQGFDDAIQTQRSSVDPTGD